ncbi:MAG TPA: hypothetical protein VGK47_07460 [Nitrososphaeraceae archaeon]
MSNEKTKEKLVENEKKESTSEVTSKEDKKNRVYADLKRVQLEYEGRLYIDPKYKKPGKVLRVVSCNPGRVRQLEAMGYTIVQDETKIGSGSLREPGQLGSAVTVEAGIRQSDPSILMEIDEDLFNARLEYKAEQNDAQLEMQIESAQYDEMTNKGKRFKSSYSN